MATARPSRLMLAARLAAVLLLAALATNAGAEKLPGGHPRIVNGVLTGDYPSTGALLRGSSPDTASTSCSGTLIGCSTFLTAAHCVDGRLATDLYVFLPHAGIFPVLSFAKHPTYDFPAGDVAVLKLGAAVDGVAPVAIESGAAPANGTPAVIVGYGRSGDPLFDYGLKRLGAVTTAACDDIPSPANDTTSVCWDYTVPIGAPGTDSNTCNGDSGGPLFVGSGSSMRVAGVTSGGSSSSCLPADHSYDASVFNYRAFIQAQGGADLANTRCGTGPQVGQPGASVLAIDGVVNDTTPQALHSFVVPSGTTRLRIAMNAVDDGLSDFDLYVEAGSAPTTIVYQCARRGPNQFGICEFSAPANDTWYVLVDRYAGGGAYQLTITEFTSTCAAPGSEDSACDDGNVCSGPDTCQSGACIGAPSANGTPCSDANTCTGPDTCQAGSCDTAPLANGTPCDDGDPCSRPDTCQAGACGGISPVLSCKGTAPGAALLSIENRVPDTRDRLAWTWRKGVATTKAEFGNPVTTTPYTVCLYDSVSGVPQRRLATEIPPGAHWKEFSRGFRYRETSPVAGGLTSILLTQGTTGRAGVQVRGKGQPLGLPALPLAKQSNVIIQLLGPNVCWSSTFSSAIDNGLIRFKAKSD